MDGRAEGQMTLVLPCVHYQSEARLCLQHSANAPQGDSTLWDCPSSRHGVFGERESLGLRVSKESCLSLGAKGQAEWCSWVMGQPAVITLEREPVQLGPWLSAQLLWC